MSLGSSYACLLYVWPPNPTNQSDIHHRITHFGNFFLQQRHAANITTNVMETFTVINSIYRNRSFWYSSSVSWFSSCNMLLLDWCNDFGQTKRTLFSLVIVTGTATATVVVVVFQLFIDDDAPMQK